MIKRLLKRYLGIGGEKTNHTTDVISFRQGIDLTELPICTFHHKIQTEDGVKDKLLNFLLDTGSNNNIINHSVVEKLNHEMMEETSSLTGMEGNPFEVPICKFTISFKDKDYLGDFLIKDMSAAFAAIKQQSGVNLHGILGSNFFRQYQYVLDFAELIAYSKANSKGIDQ